jgi:hypothetical protein
MGSVGLKIVLVTTLVHEDRVRTCNLDVVDDKGRDS